MREPEREKDRQSIAPHTDSRETTISASSHAFGGCSIRLSWNEQNQLTGIECFQKAQYARASSIPAPIARLIRDLNAYFEGGAPLPEINWKDLDPGVLTEFQQQVYQAISEIPHGETRTYGWVASRLKNPAATRAVGQALKKNPFAILIPCHRVVAIASIGGFMGRHDPEDRELEFKRQLLKLEEEYLNPVFPFLSAGTGRLDDQAAFP